MALLLPRFIVHDKDWVKTSDGLSPNQLNQDIKTQGIVEIENKSGETTSLLRHNIGTTDYFAGVRNIIINGPTTLDAYVIQGTNTNTIDVVVTDGKVGIKEPKPICPLQIRPPSIRDSLTPLTVVSDYIMVLSGSVQQNELKNVNRGTGFSAKFGTGDAQVRTLTYHGQAHEFFSPCTDTVPILRLDSTAFRETVDSSSCEINGRIATNTTKILSVKTSSAVDKFHVTGGGNVGINHSGYADKVLDVESTISGVLLPRLTTAQRNLILTPVFSEFIFNTTSGDFEYWNGSEWVGLAGTFNGALTYPNTYIWSPTGTLNNVVFPDGTNTVVIDDSVNAGGFTVTGIQNNGLNQQITFINKKAVGNISFSIEDVGSLIDNRITGQGASINLGTNSSMALRWLGDAGMRWNRVA